MQNIQSFSYEGETQTKTANARRTRIPFCALSIPGGITIAAASSVSRIGGVAESRAIITVPHPLLASDRERVLARARITLRDRTRAHRLHKLRENRNSVPRGGKKRGRKSMNAVTNPTGRVLPLRIHSVVAISFIDFPKTSVRSLVWPQRSPVVNGLAKFERFVAKPGPRIDPRSISG